MENTDPHGLSPTITKDPSAMGGSILFVSMKRTAVLAVFVFILDLSVTYTGLDPDNFLVFPFSLFNPGLIVAGFLDDLVIYFPITILYLFVLLSLLTFLKRKAARSQSFLISFLCFLGVNLLVAAHLTQALMFLGAMAMVGD